ncbi:hypothetical protein JCM19045_447 [Bacillus sp. JCM 19045]|nr:hypothetical protein JCM19045_447 [Bacillus sp. JCM 19045]
MKKWLFLMSLLFLGSCQSVPFGQNENTGGDAFTTYEYEPFSGFVSDVFESSALINIDHGLITFSNMPSEIEVGDRVRISFNGDIAESFPAQADGTHSKIVSPPEPEGATYSEKEAIQQALKQAEEFPPGDDFLDYRYITFTNYLADGDVWEISLQIYGEEEERVFQIGGDEEMATDWGYLSAKDEHFASIYTERDGLVQFTNLPIEAAIGDRIHVDYDATTRSLPPQANGSNAKLVPAETVDGASLSEKEAIQAALEIAQNQSDSENPLLYITAANYLDWEDSWGISLSDYYTDEAHYLLINSDGQDKRADRDCETHPLTDYAPTCFTGFVTENQLISDGINGLISFSGLNHSIEIGDRIDVVYFLVRESYPASSDAHFSKIITPPKPEGASLSEKEAIQTAIARYHEHYPETDFPPIITFTSYRASDDVWDITIEDERYEIE